jgi:hypothetical protein
MREIEVLEERIIKMIKFELLNYCYEQKLLDNIMYAKNVEL